MYYAKYLAPNLFDTYDDWHNNYVKDVGKEPDESLVEEAKLYFKEQFAFDPDKTEKRIKKIQENMNRRLMQDSRLTVNDVIDELYKQVEPMPITDKPWINEPVNIDFKEDK